MSLDAEVRTVAVTGAAGLIGSAVARRLLDRGLKVLALDDGSIGQCGIEHERLCWRRLDVASDSAADGLDGRGIDAVVHAAAHPGGKSLEEPVEDVRVNALGSMRVFEWCARTGTPVVYLSSSVVYGDQPAGPIPETAQPRPATVYGACKLACERWLSILGEGRGLGWTALRLFATYGAGHKPSLHQGIVNVMLTQLLAGDRVAVKGSLKRTRDLLYVEDAAEAIERAVLLPPSNRVMNVGTGVAVTVREVIDALATGLGRDPAGLRIAEEPGTVGDPVHNVGDIALARRVLAWQPRFTLAAGLAELIRLRTQAAGRRHEVDSTNPPNAPDARRPAR